MVVLLWQELMVLLEVSVVLVVPVVLLVWLFMLEDLRGIILGLVIQLIIHMLQEILPLQVVLVE
jgi:hypothetical protein